MLVRGASILSAITTKQSLIHKQSYLTTATMDPQKTYQFSKTSNMAYTNCKTCVVDMLNFDIPETASEHQYQDLYKKISKSKSLAAANLVGAVTSFTVGIAPPVAFPTETVYGLGADATSRAAIAGIFAAKGRPSDNPLIVHVSSKDHLERVIGEPLPAIYETLVEEYWPGPLTILIPVPQNSVFAENVHPGQNTIGFRVPSSKFARFFIAATDKPIAAPSANSSGKPSPTTAQHVLDDMNGKINFILDGGQCDVGVESTVIDGLHDPPLILRPGGVSQDDLIAHGKKYNNTWSRIEIGYKQNHSSHNNDDSPLTNGEDPSEAPRAPGMKYKHYAPRGKLILFENQQTYSRINSEIDHLIDSTLITTQSQLNKAIHTSQENTTAIKSSQKITFALLTTRTWSPFIDLPLDTTPPINSNHPTDTHTNNNSISRSNYRSHEIFSINLGSTPRTIAQSLFSALRTCDDLNCQYILAESPCPNPSRDDNDNDNHSQYQYDAVVERMRKAASQIIR